MMGKPVKVGITHGDINGVSYEVILKTLSAEGITELFTPIIYGVPEIAEKAKEELDLQNLKFNVIESASEAKDGKINIVALKEKPELHPGEVSKEAGKSAVEALERAVEGLKKGEVDVLVTAPISKEAVQSEEFNFPGHTEFLTQRIGEGEEALMILCEDDLRVALLTKHIPVSQIANNITSERVKDYIKKFAYTLKSDYGIVRPSIAVLSLNPHAGDGGLLGEEEEKILIPSIQEVQEEGYLAFGPFASDGFFGHGTYKNFDGILAMYHDQGLAPFKTIAKKGGVNFSAGLPYIRTSPDHGTAFDIAWQNKADASSMREAIYLAIDLYRRRKTFLSSASNPLKKYVHDRPERGDREEKLSNKNEFTNNTDD